MTKSGQSWTRTDRPDVEEYTTGAGVSLFWDDTDPSNEGWVLRTPASTDEPLDGDREDVAWAQAQAEGWLS